MHAFANKRNVNNLHVAEISLGGDITLHPGAERLTQKETKDGEHECEAEREEVILPHDLSFRSLRDHAKAAPLPRSWRGVRAGL